MATNKKGKSITFQLKDPAEKELFEYCETIHNFSGTLKRLLMGTEGFKRYQEDKRANSMKTPLKTNAAGAGIKIKIGG